MRYVSDSEVAEIRADLPFDPPWLEYCFEAARWWDMFPISLFRIQAGLTFDLAKAYPKGHPRQLAIREKQAADQRVRYRVSKLDIHWIGERQNWRCIYCDVKLTDKRSPKVEGAAYTHDHIIPLNPRLGEPAGETTEENIQLTCRRRNIRKGNMSDVAKP